MSGLRASMAVLAVVIGLWAAVGVGVAQEGTGSSDDPLQPFDLTGFWLDGERVVRVTQNGSEVTGMYVKPAVCDHGDGTSSETDLDFVATLDGITLTGELTACYWETANPAASGFIRVPLELTLNDNNTALEGTWYNSVNNQNIPLTITRIGCRLAVFNGPNFVGDQVVADLLFIPMLERIDAYAGARRVQIHVTSSLRTSTNVAGAIVDPATSSNHLIGHAIDMNVYYWTAGGTKTLCNSTCLARRNLPADVLAFLNDIRSDPDLRWGGDFNTRDPVHIDDGLNLNDPAAWQEIYDEVQAAPACFLSSE